MSCYCNKPTPVFDWIKGEHICKKCAVVIGTNVELPYRSTNSDNAGNDIGYSGGEGGRVTQNNKDIEKLPISQYTKRMVKQSTKLRRYSTLYHATTTLLSTISANRTMYVEVEQLIQKIVKKRIFKSRPTNVLAGSLVLFTAHIYGHTITFKQVLKLVNCKKSSQLSRMYEEVKTEFKNIQVMDIHERTKILLLKYHNELGIKNFRNSLKLLDIMHELKQTDGKNPNVVSAFILYICTRATEADVLKITNISSISLHNYIKQAGESGFLKKHYALLFKQKK